MITGCIVTVCSQRPALKERLVLANCFEILSHTHQHWLEVEARYMRKKDVSPQWLPLEQAVLRSGLK
jgi:hypothetical protein